MKKLVKSYFWEIDFTKKFKKINNIFLSRSQWARKFKKVQNKHSNDGLVHILIELFQIKRHLQQ